MVFSSPRSTTRCWLYTFLLEFTLIPPHHPQRIGDMYEFSLPTPPRARSKRLARHLSERAWDMAYPGLAREAFEVFHSQLGLGWTNVQESSHL